MSSEASNNNPDQALAPAETATFYPPEFVNLSLLELEVSGNPIPQPSSPFSLPQPSVPQPSEPQSQNLDANANFSTSQGSPESVASQPVQEKKAKEENSCTLDEFWMDAGKPWNVTTEPERDLEDEFSEMHGLSACASGPECATCGEHLELDELLSFVPCRTCGCFN
ncbi:hypothetical protein F5B20DRAFT_584697 [Whalleya microplaca]|nr:hypothetical protein F5B20DRAFT_584697 [Whalleya microplaca]